MTRKPSPEPLDKALYAAVVAEAQRRFKWPSRNASWWVSGEYKRRGGAYAAAPRDNPEPDSMRRLKELRGELARVAQSVYDEWDASDEAYGDSEIGFGGICHLIADKMASLLWDKGFKATTVSATHEVHVYVVMQARDGVFMVDIPPSVYETGGGYNWKKIPNVVFTADDVVVDQLSNDPKEMGIFVEEWEDDDDWLEENPLHEPYSDVETLRMLAGEGHGSFDDYYERWDTEDLDPEDLRYGRKVIWQVTPGRAIKIDPDYVVSMPENIFDPDKLAAVVDAVQSGEKPVFEVGYGTVRVIGERDVAESQEAFEHGETLTQRPLDDDDIGKLLFTVRDGNHRVFGALIAGERHVWMHLYDNDLQDVREWRRDRKAYLSLFSHPEAQDARMQLFSDLLDEGDS